MSAGQRQSTELTRMEDPEVVAAIVAGKPAGLAAAYDRHAAGLHAYCLMKLNEPADAEGAVQDTFVIAAARLRKLRDRGRLRPWLYAVARNECVRRRRARPVTLDRLITADMAGGKATDETMDLGAAAEQADLRRLVEVTLGEMSPGNREVVELGLRHDLHGTDLADALGVPPDQADTLTSRAISRFETLLGRLLVLRAGRESCPELNTVLAGQDVDPAVVDHHIQRCTVCGERARPEQSPAALVALAPMTGLPAGLRAQTLQLAEGASPASIAHREQVARRAEPFGHGGFPEQLDQCREAPRTGRRMLAAAAVLVTMAVLIAGVLFAMGTLNGQTGTLDGHARTLGTPSPATGAPDGPAAPPAALPAAPPAAPSPSPRLATPRASGSHAASSRPTRAPSPTASARRSPSSQPTTSGTLAVPGTVTLTRQPGGGYAGSFELTARGGPVADYGINVTAPAARQLTVTPSSGALAAGQAVTVTVTAAPKTHGKAPEYLTVTPGGQTITVVYG
jgi:RNA polymerase sigma factor (sigma-70 family)